MKVSHVAGITWRNKGILASRKEIVKKISELSNVTITKGSGFPMAWRGCE
jgi:hypothetical protein